MAKRVPARLSSAEGRRFALTVGSAFLALALLLTWRGHARAATAVAGGGAGLILAGLIAPGALGPVYRAWMRFGEAMSRITTPIFLGVVYFLVVFPFGWLRRVTGHRTLEHRLDNDGYWIARGKEQSSDLRRQF